MSRSKRNCTFGACADSEGPDQTTLPRSLIRAFAVRCQNYWIVQNVSMQSKGPDETLRMCRMMWIRLFCACSKAIFRLKQPMWLPRTCWQIHCFLNVWPFHVTNDSRNNDKYLDWPRHAKTCLRAYSDSEGPDQPAHPRRLIRPSLSANKIIGYYRKYALRAKTWMILCWCAGLSESAHFARVRRHFFAWRDPDISCSSMLCSVRM